MTGYNRVFIDTAPFIYYFEKNEDNLEFHNRIKKFFIESHSKGIELITSVITVEEYCVYPYRTAEAELIKEFERFIDQVGIDVCFIDENLAKAAAKIRAEYTHFKAMDALQLAVAEDRHCDMFLTNDKQLKQYNGMICKTIDEI